MNSSSSIARTARCAGTVCEIAARDFGDGPSSNERVRMVIIMDMIDG